MEKAQKAQNQLAVNNEADKYETTATIKNTVKADADVKDTIIAPKADQTADSTITLTFKEKEDTGNYLTTVDNTSIVLAKQAVKSASDNTATITLTFTKGTATKSINVVVTIEPQTI